MKKVGIYDDEKVVIMLEGKERSEIWVPSRQVQVSVHSSIVKKCFR